MTAVNIRAVVTKEFLLEQRPDLFGRQLLTSRIGDRLHDLAELDLQPSRHGDAVVALEQISDAALARLTVDANDRLVRAAHIARVDRQIRNLPNVALAARGET